MSVTLIYVGSSEHMPADLAFLPPDHKHGEQEVVHVDDLGDLVLHLALSDPDERYLIAYGQDVAERLAAEPGCPPACSGAAGAIVLAHGSPDLPVFRGAAALGASVLCLPQGWPALLHRLGAAERAQGRES